MFIIYVSASLIVIIARRSSEAVVLRHRGRVQIDVLLSRQSIGEFLGLTTETVSRQMSALKAQGHIEYGAGRTIVIKDFEAFTALAGEDDDGGVVP